MAEQDKMKAYCTGDEFFWMDVDTFEMLRIAENMLPKSSYALSINKFQEKPSICSLENGEAT